MATGKLQVALQILGLELPKLEPKGQLRKE
jgi:hypothetical protein